MIHFIMFLRQDTLKQIHILLYCLTFSSHTFIPKSENMQKDLFKTGMNEVKKAYDSIFQARTCRHSIILYSLIHP